MANWILLILLTLLPLLPLVLAIVNAKNGGKQLANKQTYYVKEVLYSTLFLAVLYLLQPNLFTSFPFAVVGSGYDFAAGLLPIAITISMMHLVLSFTNRGDLYPRDIASAKEVYALPVSQLPDTKREHLLFTVMLLSGVVIEEVLCRQLWFSLFHHTLHLGADALMITTAILFAVLHLYQGWKGLLSNLVYGLILGKIFLEEGSLFYPILVHAMINLPVVVLSYRRIRDLKRLGVPTS